MFILRSNRSRKQKSSIKKPNETTDLSVIERALYIDHIREKIIDSLETNDLLNCRLVSHQWLLFAQTSLQKKVTLKFQYHIPIVNWGIDGSVFARLQNFFEMNFLSIPAQLRRETELHNLYQNLSIILLDSGDSSLKKLTKFLRKGKSKAKVKPDEFSSQQITRFPCSKFEFMEIGLNNKHLQNFLDTFGTNVKQLTIGIFLDSSNKACLLSVMQQLTRLLILQAPNLEELTIIHLDNHWWNNQRKIPDLNKVLQKGNAFLQVLQERSPLKVLNLRNGIQSAFYLDFVAQLCPHLQILNLKSTDYIYFLEPANRLHLLKQLVFDFGRGSTSLETFEKISSANLQLKLLEIGLDSALYRFKHEPWMYPRVGKLIQLLLETSWNTLELIKINGGKSLEGMEWPEIMPNVCEIQFNNLFDFPNLDDPMKIALFPSQFSFPKKFPCLQTVRILFNEGSGEFYFCAHFFENLPREAGNLSPVSSTVKNIILNPATPYKPSEYCLSFARNMKCVLQPIFPNAKIRLQIE